MESLIVEVKENESRNAFQPYSGMAVILLASVASFITYTSVYGFRKPYTASSYDGIYLLGLSYKSVLVMTQVIGYMCGKFYGIRFIAAVDVSKRGSILIKVVLLAWLALLLFAIVPAPYNFIFMFVNGFPLAITWGLVFGYLEGRKVTEIMGAVLATSLIFASGLAKTVGKWLMLSVQVSQWWMPFISGAVFLVPLLASVWCLNRIPGPNADDIAHRTLRKPMNRTERNSFIKRFGMALTPVIIAYSMLTILRDFCEDFANELWKEVGLGHKADIFVNTSTIVALMVLLVVVGFFFVKNNYRAFQLNHVVIVAGFAIAIIATLFFSAGKISAYDWMIAATFGLYLGYVPYNCFYFERLLATYKVEGNVGFVMYIADSFGYLGTVLVLFVSQFVHLHYTWVHLFKLLFYSASVTGIILVIISSGLFGKIFNSKNETLT